MSKWSIAAKPKDEQNKVNVDLALSGVACKMRISELWTYGKQQLVSFMKKTSLLVCASLISTVVFALDNAGNSELKAMGARGRENLEKNLTRNVSVKKYAEEILKLQRRREV